MASARFSHQTPQGHPMPGAPSPLVKWGAACTQCAAAKAKCLRSNTTPGSECDRCKRLGKNCADQVHKPRKKRQCKPSKTAQLEERLNGLVKLLQTSGDISSATGGDLAGGLGPVGSVPATHNQTFSNRHTPSPASQENACSSRGSSPYVQTNAQTVGPTWIPDTYNCHGPPHCVCRPKAGQAPGPTDSDDTLLTIYREELTPAYPFVIIPNEVTAGDLRATRPFLMSCIRKVASVRSMRSMHGQMYRLMSHIADHMLMRSERSLDLLSGIVVILGWHHYHCCHHAQLQNLVSLAVTLTAELGLKRKPSWQERTKLMVMDLGELKERANEEKRLLLAVWYISSSVSLGFQQLDSMRFSPYMQQCLRELEQEQECESDPCLVQFIRIQLLSEKIALLNSNDEVDEGQEGFQKAPTSAYVSAYRAELDNLCTNMPPSLRDNGLISARINTARLRLFEPPRLNAALLTSIAKSFTTAPPIPGTPSPLDAFYHSSAALKTLCSEWLSFPVSLYYCVPLPVFLDLIYATTMLGRWAKLAAPGTVRPDSSPVPADPSGAYNNCLGHLATTPTAADSPDRDRQLAQAIATLKTQLATQPGLKLDVTGFLCAMSSRFEHASAALASPGTEPQAWDRNIWAVGAAKLRIVQLKLEQWAEMVSGEGVEEQDGEVDDRGDDEGKEEETTDGGISAGGEGDVEIPDPEGYALAMEGWTASLMTSVGMPLVEDLFQDMNPFLWMGGMEDWG